MKLSNIFACLFGAFIFALIPALILHFELKDTVKNAELSESWPTTQGTVLKSKSIYKVSSSNIRSYQPYIWYKYYVDGKVYGSRVIVNTASGSPISGSDEDTQAKEFLKDYPVGSNMPVYYNPEKPEDATLITGTDTPTIIVYYVLHVVFVIAACVFLFFLMVLVYALKLIIFKEEKTTNTYTSRASRQNHDDGIDIK